MLVLPNILSGCFGGSVILLDWTVYWPWSVWGDQLYTWCITTCSNFLVYLCNLCNFVETSTCSTGQPYSSIPHGTFLCIAWGIFSFSSKYSRIFLLPGLFWLSYTHFLGFYRLFLSLAMNHILVSMLVWRQG